MAFRRRRYRFSRPRRVVRRRRRSLRIGYRM